MHDHGSDLPDTRTVKDRVSGKSEPWSCMGSLGSGRPLLEDLGAGATAEGVRVLTT